MIIHSTVPLDLVLSGIDNTDYQFEEITHGGITMQVERISPDRVKIVRLFSGDLADYLNPSYQPGSILSFRAEE